MFNFGNGNKKKATKKINQKDDASDTSHGPKKIRRKRRGGKKSVKQYPAINQLKIRESVPSAVLTDLEKDAENKSGAVRRVSGGYLVIAIDEQTLELNGLSPKNKTDDLGALSGSIHKDVITSASLRGDLENGYLIIVPNKVTIDALSEFDQLSNENEFTWALFPEQIDDDDDEARTKILQSHTDVSSLKEIAKNGDDAAVDSNGNVTFGGVSESSPSQQPAANQPPAEEAGTNDSQPTEDDNLDTDGLFAGGEDDAGDEPAKPSPEPEPVVDDSLFADNPAPQQQPAQPEPQPTPPTENADNNQPQPETPTPEPEQQPQPANPEPVINEGDVDDYQNQVDVAGLQNLYDDDLHIKVDTDEFNMLYGQITPMQLDGETEKKPLTTELQAAVNALTNEANQKLRDLNEYHRQQFTTEFVNRAQSALNSISQQLATAGKNTLVSQAKRVVEQKFDKSMDNLPQLEREATKDIQADYDRRREEAGQAAALAAKQAFDNDNLGNLQDRKNAIAQQLKNDITNHRINALADLNQKRQEIAKNTYRDAQTRIMDNMAKYFEDLHDDEKELADAYSERLNVLVDNYYQDDVKHQQALADIATHDNEVREVRQQMADLQYQSDQAVTAARKEAEQAKADADKRANDAIANAQNQYNQTITNQKRELNDNFNTKLQQSIDNNKILQAKNDNLSHENSELENQMANKIKSFNDQLNNKDSRYQELIDRNQNVVDSLEERHQKALKHNSRLGFTVGGLGIVVSALVGALLGAKLMSTPTNSRSDTGSGINIINPSAPTTSSTSSSANVNSNNAASSSSDNNNTDSSSNNNSDNSQSSSDTNDSKQNSQKNHKDGNHDKHHDNDKKKDKK